jgi:cell division protein FtsI (penicillin-binding protein 3)
MHGDQQVSGAGLADAPSRRGRRTFSWRWRWGRPANDGGRARIRLAAVCLAAAYLAVIARLVLFGLAPPELGKATLEASSALASSRPDLVDRHGQILATDLRSASLYAEPRKIIDPDEAAEAIAAVFPDIDQAKLRDRLATNAGFAWIRREVTPAQERAIHDRGIPGLGLVAENRRFYPGGPTAAHLVGMVNVDNQGIAGFEKYIDDTGLADLHTAGFARGEALAPVAMSIDLRVQSILRDELQNAILTYSAAAATGIVLDVDTGEVVAMASLPDFDPNDPVDAQKPDRLNRASAGVYELGSVFKSFTFAMALDSGAWTLADRVDASEPIEAGGFTIHDFHGKRRVLTVPEAFVFSSNIGAAKMALKVGPERQQEYFRRFGFFDELRTELPESARPLVPARWPELTAMTTAFGHGIAVTPLQVAVADAALVNGGILIPPTFTPRTTAEAARLGRRVVSEQTSRQVRYLLRLNVEDGSGDAADVPGYLVGGKTGTAEKVENGTYSSTKNLNSFLAAFPIDAPEYVVLVVLDDPRAPRNGGGTTAASNATPVVGAIIRRTAALLGVEPRRDGAASALLVSN